MLANVVAALVAVVLLLVRWHQIERSRPPE
jgi:hypothetical protein